MDWYQSLAVFSTIVALALVREVFVIRKHLNLDDWTPTRKWKKAFEAKRRDPKHRPDKIPEYAEDQDRQFYDDTIGIADWFNTIFVDSPWCFENTGELEAGYGGLSRKLDVWYHGVKTCRITISQIGNDRPTLNTIEISLINGRAYDGQDVISLLVTVANILHETPAERDNAKDAIQNELINAMWRVGDEFGNRPVDLFFTGNLYHEANRPFLTQYHLNTNT